MKQFLRYIFLLAMIVATANVWAQCYIYESPNNKEYSFTIASGTNTSHEFPLNGEGGTLEYYHKLSGSTTVSKNHYITTQWKSEGGSWTDIHTLTTKSNKYADNPTTVEIPREADYIRFKGSAETGGARSISVKNIKVSRAKYADQPGPEVTEWTASTKMIGSASESASTTMAWSNTTPFTYEITGASQFSASITNNASTCNYGNATISATYEYTTVGTHEATLTIKTAHGNYNIKLKGTTLDKYTANFQWVLGNTYLIDDQAELINIYGLTRASDNSDVKSALHNSITFSSSDPNVVSIEDGKIIAKHAGEATITATFAGNNEWHGFTKTLKLTINKHTPVFAWNGQAVNANQSVLFNTPYDNYFVSSSTKNLEEMSFTYSSSDEEVAIWSAGDAARSLDLTTFNKPKTITLTVTQTENWYWYGKSETHTITPQYGNNHVPFTIDTETKMKSFHISHTSENTMSWSNSAIQIGGGGDGLDYGKELVIGFIGIPKDLSFSYGVATSGTTGEKWAVYESKDGQTWSEAIWSAESGESGTVTNQALQPTTQYLKFYYAGNFGCYFKDITVTELDEFYAVETTTEEEKTEVEHLYFDANQVYTNKTLTFDIKYANAGYKVTATSNDSHFTVTPIAINTIGGEKHGTQTFTVTYTSTLPYATTDNNSYITIKDELDELKGHKDIVYLHASSYKSTQVLQWKDIYAAVEEPTIRLEGGDIYNAATATSDLIVTYESSNTEVIDIVNKGTAEIPNWVLSPKKAGEATITAKQAGNELWLPATPITKTFIVTDKIVQYIAWHDNLSDLVIGTGPITLTAKVYVQDNETGEYTYSEERTKLLQYSSQDPNIVSISGNVLTIHNVGETTATVIAPGNDDYAQAKLIIPVQVRPETAGCEDIPLLDSENEMEFFAFDLNRPEITKTPFDIDLNKGIPGTLSFQHRGASWDFAVQYYSGNIVAEYITTDDTENWKEAITVTPTEDQTNTASGIALPRNAKQVRFRRPQGGTGYHYVSNIQVHPAQFIEAPDIENIIKDNIIDFGEIHVGSKETKTFTISYSNIKYALSPTISNTQDISATPNSFGVCSGFGTQEISVTWTPSNVNANAQETITFTDPNSGMKCVVTLKANIKKGTQNINWSAPTTISDCSFADFPEKSTADIPITWQVIEGTDVANFNNGILEIYKSGTIKVQGSNTGSDNYNAFTTPTYTITIEADPVFVGTVDSNWHNPENWTICRLPLETEAITIKAPAVLSTHATVAGVTFAAGDNDKIGTLHITYTGGLTIGTNGVTAAADGSSIVIDNTHEGAGFLRIHPDYNGAMPKVTVRYQTRSTLDTGANKDATWQYIGAPGANTNFTVDHITWLYHWSETGGWINKTGAITLQPFAGYAITQYGQPTYELTTTPIITNQTITLTKTEGNGGMNGDNLFANSFTSPIDAKNFTDEDFTDNVEKTFYIFNSGSWNQWNENQNAYGTNGTNTPGQYFAIPALSSKYLDNLYDVTTIPPMQGVYIIAKEDNESITLNYDKHVWHAGSNTTNTNMNEPMRTPQYTTDNDTNDLFMRLRIQVSSANSGSDRMYIIQDTTATMNYDNGYDAPNQIGEGLANIYTNEPFGKMEVSCSNNIDSMYIGFTAGQDSIYTLTFNSLIGNPIYLQDLENDSIIQLTEGGKYVFQTIPQQANDLRFQVLLHPELPNQNQGSNDQGTTSDLTHTDNATIWAHGKTIYIANVPANSIATLYNISGQALITNTIPHTPYALNLSHMPKGVYILRINNHAYKFISE